MKDIFDKTRTFTRAKEAMAMGFYPYFQPLADSDATTATFKGKEVVMIGSNNYLGLTTHPKVKQASMEAVERFGTSCTGSRFLNGTLEFHLELDRRLARFVGKEAALVFSTGYQTNVGTISAIVQRGDFAILDKDDHASIVDGCFLARGMSQADMPPPSPAARMSPGAPVCPTARPSPANKPTRTAAGMLSVAPANSGGTAANSIR